MKFRNKVVFVLPFIILNIFSGVAVAGIDAGKVYNTWPLMNGSFFSYSQYFKINSETWSNFFENKFTVQFNHRNLAYVTYFYSMCKIVILRFISLIEKNGGVNSI